MYILMSIACLLSTIHVNGLRETFFFDEATYNPCGTNSGAFFYVHPSDPHKYYQCDEFGNAFLRSCDELVWDELRVTCNWPSAVASPSTEEIGTWTMTTTLWPTTGSSWPSTAAETWPTTGSSWSSATPTWPTATTETSSPVVTLFSLCTPINPCGEHGKCVESLRKTRDSTPRFACICSEDWFGRLCDKHIDELTTPSPLVFDKIQKIDTFSSRFKAANNLKIIPHESKPIDKI